MIDEKEIRAARDQIAGLCSTPIFETNVGDVILIPWNETTFLCQIQQRNARSDVHGAHWAVRVRMVGRDQKSDWSFFLDTDYRVIVVKGAS